MSPVEWEQFSSFEDDGMVCPKPDTKAGDAFWDYGGDFDPSEYGRKPGDALNDAVTEMNDGYKTETGGTEGFLPESGWVGLTHEDGNTIYFVYPETSWEFIVSVSGDASKGAWRHQKATVCAPTK